MKDPKKPTVPVTLTVESPEPMEVEEDKTVEKAKEQEPAIERVQPVPSKLGKYPPPFTPRVVTDGMDILTQKMVEVARGGGVQQLRAIAVANCPSDKDSARRYQETMRRLRDAAEAAYQSAMEQSNLVLLG